MSVDAVYYVNCVFAWVLVLLGIIGYFYTLHQTGERWAFWLIFATSWILFAISHSMKIAGVEYGVTASTAIRIVAYSLMVIAVLSLILRVRQASR